MFVKTTSRMFTGSRNSWSKLARLYKSSNGRVTEANATILRRHFVPKDVTSFLTKEQLQIFGVSL